ncbi:hypothetical protein PR048_030969 [Dryococelus australis]|uniref:Mannosyl-oligosaccharide 1,2-alpha-mannosidase IA n=1 Tax=Dryococelus australis TaxID=614101 RepID=A0ABQ9GAF7_9NEOP|nr:hypothetical protein PR048_030969 [Dryococelus australis]
MASTTGILPTYQRFVNGVPVPSFSRRSFRPREKYLILLVFMTFGVVCFGAFFFLPEFRGGSNTVNSVYNVYKHMQNAGPELLIPAPPRAVDEGDVSGGIVKPFRRDSNAQPDPHLVYDRNKLQAKIKEDGAASRDNSQKVLEKPRIIGHSVQTANSSCELGPRCLWWVLLLPGVTSSQYRQHTATATPS